MWTPQYEIIIEALTGSEFEITVSAKDTVGYIKSRIQKHEGMYDSYESKMFCTPTSTSQVVPDTFAVCS